MFFIEMNQQNKLEITIVFFPRVFPVYSQLGQQNLAKDNSWKGYLDQLSGFHFSLFLFTYDS